ncbi:putative zinc binding dehydrogenase [Schistosoma mansoni]|uniref:Enoyl-[acyl-carrier-protein] reductase, mitochondrial n=1 Tax=Schistosoma mansoni TaxID=6183 RepID=G4VEY4_SCHMA|nr:putative zinc binding dehydrogenase [Schistosoma mansoni]|eukprot:XP_018651103.1 putative zinc binding dehydrogenase [Schistosoma mansoni]
MLRSSFLCNSKKWNLLHRLVHSEAITYTEHGDPEQVLRFSSTPVHPFANDEILVKVCAAPINPSDINTIQGNYPIKPKLPAVAGNEGAGKIIACGKNVDGFSIGDTVIPLGLASGTWQTYWCGKADSFLKIKYPISMSCAATLAINPSTALHLLNNFVELQKGDILIQNGATSAVGIYVIQIAKILGYNTVNLFRERGTPEATEETRNLLRSYGGTWCLTESEYMERAKEMGPFKLALNCLGGKPASILVKNLSNSGTMVTYGGMTRNPMPLPVGPFIFKDISLRGFWLSSFNLRQSPSKRQLTVDQLSKWFCEDLIKPSPFEEIPFKEWRKALHMSLFSDSVPTSIRKKSVLIME